MDFASKFAYMPKSAAEVEEEVVYDDDEDDGTTGALFTEATRPPDAARAAPRVGLVGRLFGSLRGSAAPAPASAAPAPPRPAGTARRVEVDTNVVSFRCAQLAQPPAIHTGDVVTCRDCSVAFSAASKLGPDGSMWTCEFCGLTNPVSLSPEEIPAQESIDYILQPAPAVVAEADETRVIFCVDISGSMCVSVPVDGAQALRGANRGRLADDVRSHGEGDQVLPRERRGVTYISRLQAVQAAVDQQLKKMSQEHPHRKVAMIVFNNAVAVLGDGSTAPVTLAGDTLNNADALRRAAVEFGANVHGIGTRYEALNQKLFELEESSTTALGPALLVAVTMAAQTRGSKVVVCTDGLANTGIGSLDGYATMDALQQAAADEFYRNLGTTAADAGVTVSVISIIGEECQLERLGQLADVTGGDVERVSLLTLKDNFSNILEKPVLAFNVTATMFLHRGLHFRNADADPNANRFTIQLGNVNADSEAFYEFGVRRDRLPAAPTATVPTPAAPASSNTAAAPSDTAPSVDEVLQGDSAATAGTAASPTAAAVAAAAAAPAAAAPAEQPSSLPFQLQIKYTRPDGMVCLRVITRLQPVTTDAARAREDVQVAICAAHATQESSRLAQKGLFKAAQAKSKGTHSYLQRHVTSSASQAQKAEMDSYSLFMDEHTRSTKNSETAVNSAAGVRRDEDARHMYRCKKMASSAFK